MLDQALGLLDHHLGDLDVTYRRLVECRGHDLALHRALHVGHFFRTFIDQQNDQVAFRMVRGDRVGDVLQQHRLAGARLRHDQRTLALAERRYQIDDARRDVLAGRVVDLHLQPLGRIERRQIVEMDLVPDLFGIVEIDRIDLEQREIALALFRAADRPLDGIAGLQREAPDLRRRDVDIVRSGQIIGVCGAQEAKTVLQHLDHAVADDLDVLRGKLLEDREHQLLLAHDAGVLDLERFGERDQIGRFLVLEFLEFHFLHVAELWQK